MVEKKKKVFVAGAKGLVGSSVCRVLEQEGHFELLTPSSKELDLCDFQATLAFFEAYRPDHVILAAAKVGGIHANESYPAEFIKQNLDIQSHVIDAAFRFKVDRLIFLGSSCIYPKVCPQPIREEYLLSGPLEPTNRPYALAKIAGIELCWAYNRQYGCRYVALMPTNLYGPGDNYHRENSHVIPGIITKLQAAVKAGDSHVQLWGSGTPRREFLHSKDLARAINHILMLPEVEYTPLVSQPETPPLLNVGWGEDIPIAELALLIQELVGYKGTIIWDTSKPDGTLRKCLDIHKILALGWQPRISLREGLKHVLEGLACEFSLSQ